MIGETIDRYRVVEKLGQGGMGVVYKARDTLLGRFVAMKALPPESPADEERRRRFIDEAKAASALQHPGIVSVYDVVQAEGQDFIVMEYVPGETLEQRMGQRALPLSRGLRYGEQIADALARAHAAGIVHRDLKPSNVMVTEDDTAKILDFGLAKLTQAPFPGDEAPTVSRGHAHLSREGAVAGTLAYMSPEQAAGRPVDARTDVFSFGVLLYEMLTGRHPFRRGSQLETLSAIREAEPERPSQVAPGLPPEAERAILRCLHKEPSRRWQSMSDLKAVLQDLREDSESGRARGAATPERAKRSRAWWWAAGAAFVLAAAAAAFLLYARLGPRAGPGPLELSRLTYDSGYTSDPTISADGKLIAYASDRSGEGHTDIWVQHPTQRDAARLTHDPADDRQPTLSPDGSRVVFRSERDGGGLYVVSTLGGPERRIADGGLFPRFSPDGSQVAYLREAGWTPRGLLPMFLVPAEGGTPRPFQPDFGVPDSPGSFGVVWSPDGRHILFRGARLKPPGERDWWVAPVEGGPAVATGATGATSALPQLQGMQAPCAWIGHHVLLAAGTTLDGVNLYRVRIGADFRVSGPPEPLTSGTGISHTASVSQDGHVVVPRWSGLVQLWSVDPEAPAGARVPEAITRDGTPKYGLGLDRRGGRIVYTAATGLRGQYRMEFRVRNLASGEETVPLRLPSPATFSRPRLSPDGALLAWEDIVEDTFATFVGKADAPSGRELCRDCRLLGFASDGRRVLLRTGPRRVVLRDVSGGSEIPVFEQQAGSLLDADLSWDDRWLATLVGGPDSTVAIHVVPLAEDAARGVRSVEIARSDRWLSSPRWSPDGSRVYYLSPRDGFLCIWAQSLDLATKAPRGDPFAVFHAHRNPWRMVAPRGVYSLALAPHRLAFIAAELTGSVLMAKLPPE